MLERPPLWLGLPVAAATIFLVTRETPVAPVTHVMRPAFATPTLPDLPRHAGWSIACVPRPYTVLTPFRRPVDRANWTIDGDFDVCEGFGGPWSGHGTCRRLGDGAGDRRDDIFYSYSNGWPYPLMNGMLQDNPRIRARIDGDTTPYPQHRERPSAARPTHWNGCTIWSDMPLTENGKIAIIDREAWNVAEDRRMEIPSPGDARLVGFDLAGEHVLAQWQPRGCLDATCRIASVVDANGKNLSGFVEGGGKTAALGSWFVLVDGRGVVHRFDRTTGRSIPIADNRSLTDGDRFPDDAQISTRDDQLIVAWRDWRGLRVRVAKIAIDGWTIEEDVTIDGPDCAE